MSATSGMSASVAPNTWRKAFDSAASLSGVEVACAELKRLPDYYQSLLRLLLTSSPTQDMRDGISEQIFQSFQQGLEEIRAAGELAEWADASALASRLATHLRMTSLDWAAGHLDDEGLRATSLYGSCLIVLGVATGTSRRELEASARSVQSAATPAVHSKRHAKPARS